MRKNRPPNYFSISESGWQAVRQSVRFKRKFHFGYCKLLRPWLAYNYIHIYCCNCLCAAVTFLLFIYILGQTQAAKPTTATQTTTTH